MTAKLIFPIAITLFKWICAGCTVHFFWQFFCHPTNFNKGFRGAGLLFVAVIGPPAFAGPFEDGTAAIASQDYATAMRLLRPLAERGHARAQYYLGRMYEYGWGVQQSSVQAVIWYRK